MPPTASRFLAHMFKDREPPLPQAGPKRRILVVEDNGAVAQTIAYTLQSAGHEVKSTARGKDVSRLIELLEPDLVITDVILPEGDMIDSLAELRRRHPRTKVIAISGNPYLLTIAARDGADHVLAKPFGVHQLLLVVKVALQ